MFLYTHAHRIFISNICMFISSIILEKKNFMQSKLYTKNPVMVLKPQVKNI